MNAHSREILRYCVNGLAATALHYGVLTFNLTVIQLPSAGLANLIAALFGISASFLGSRYFVFRGGANDIFTQGIKFGALYGAIAILHGLFLLIWTDWIGHDYRVGFLLATSVQVLGSYFGNKFLVFRT